MHGRQERAAGSTVVCSGALNQAAPVDSIDSMGRLLLRKGVTGPAQRMHDALMLHWPDTGLGAYACTYIWMGNATNSTYRLLLQPAAAGHGGLGGCCSWPMGAGQRSLRILTISTGCMDGGTYATSCYKRQQLAGTGAAAGQLAW